MVGWFEKARRLQRHHESSPFEAFIYLWISFNGWAACVTQLDIDRQWVSCLANDEEIADDFSHAIATVPDLSIAAQRFHAYWPIFEVRHLRRRELLWHGLKDRSAIIKHYIANGATECEPRCAIRHLQANEPIPLDWPHTVNALYRVRCNLFHGEKSLQSEDDESIVSAALACLLLYLGSGRLAKLAPGAA